MLIQLIVIASAFCMALVAQTDEQIQKSQQARELMSRGQFAEAIPLYRDLTKAIPGNPGLLLNLGMAQHMAGQDRDAISQFQSVLKLQPDTFPALAMMGAAYIRLGQASAAIAPLRRALRAQPKNAEVRRMLAEALLMSGRNAEAAEEFDQLAAQVPRNPYAWYGLGRSYEGIALESFQRVAKDAPGSPWWLTLIAESRVKQKRNSSAFYFFRQALEKDPGFRGAHEGLATVYRESGHPDWAQVAEQKLKQLGDPDCQKHAIECHYRAGRFFEVLQATNQPASESAHYWRTKAANELALRAFSQLESLGPSLPLHRFRADQHRAQGRYRDSAEELREALKLQPGDLQLQKDLAASLYLSRNYSEAEPLLRQLLEQQPAAADLQFLLGDTLLQLQRTEKAIPLLAKAVQSDPKLLPAHSALGRGLVQSGKAAEAIPHLKAALPMDEDGSVHYQLVRAYQLAGRKELAAQTMRKYQEIQKANAAAQKELETEAQITPPH